MNIEFVSKLQKSFEGIPSSQINQSMGTYYPGRPGCAVCFGAHIARIVGVPTREGRIQFYYGEEEFYKLVGLNKLQIVCLLNDAGVGHYSPFSILSWKHHPSVVLKNLLTMDKLSFAGKRLYKISIEFGSIERENFENSKLQNLEFISVNLSGSNFKNAELRFCNFAGSNLRGANFCGTLLGVNLDATSLEGALYDSDTMFPRGFTEEVAIEKGMIKVERENKVLEFPKQIEFKEAMP